jgi:hypothetical protein
MTVPADDWPTELKPYADLVQRCAKYDSFVPAPTGGFVEEFGAASNQSWRALPTPFAPPTVENRRVGDRDVLAITALMEQGNPNAKDAPALIAVGPAVTGNVRVEMVAYSDVDKPCDLSIILGPIGQSPGFQFGGYRNTRNTLWADTGETNSWRAIALPVQTLIQPRQWHTVRLDLVNRELIAAVDGKVLGRTRLSDQFDPRPLLQPTIYCYDTSILVDRFTVVRGAATNQAALQAQAWRNAFGDQTPADVDRVIATLIKLLDDESAKLRDGAQNLLTQMGAFAEPALRAALQNGTIEQRLRAREILQLERAP